MDSARVVSISQRPTPTSKADLKVWDPYTSKEIQMLAGHLWGVDAIAVLPVGRRVIVSAGGPWIRALNRTAGASKHLDRESPKRT
jgi:hypothetical protein